MVNLRNLSFFNVPEGVQHFPGGGGSTFSRGGGGAGGGGGGGGVQLLIPYRNPKTCDFPGGSGPPVPPSGSTLE